MLLFINLQKYFICGRIAKWSNAEDCKSLIVGSNPTLASFYMNGYCCKNIFFRFILFISTLFIISVAYFANANEKSVVNNVNNYKQDITLTMAMSNDFPPFDFTDKNNNNIGIDVDILDEITKRTGIKFELKIMSFGSIIAAITTGKVDGAISGMTVTEDRKKNVDFTIPYYDANYALIVKKADNIKSIKDLHGHQVGSQTGTTMYDYLVDYNQTINDYSEKLILSSIDGNSVGIQALRSGKLKGYLLEELQGEAFCAKHNDLSYILIKNDNGKTAIALQKNSKYTAIIDKAIKQMLDDGTITNIINKWEKQHINTILSEEYKIQHRKALFGIVKSALYTIQYSILSMFFGLLFGLMFTLFMCSNIKILVYISKIYVSVIRGTPMLLQLSIVYFGISNLIGINLSIFTSGIIAFSLNSAAYIVEIIRSGIRSIDKGQFDACRSLNLSKYNAIKDVYIPQILHNIFPTLVNEFIALIKESSIISVIGGYEIMKTTNIVVAQYYDYFVPLLVAGLTYYLMTFTLERIAKFWEKRYKY